MPAEQDTPAPEQPAGSTNHSANVNASRLLLLRLELRRIIILDVLHNGYQGPPTASKNFIKNRIRPQNRIDRNYPTGMRIYLPRRRTWLHGNGVLQTNRQLLHETLDLIEDTLKTGIANIPFELDVMVIKGMGILPTWTSFPYKPQHIKHLKITFRVFRQLRWTAPEKWAAATMFKYPDGFDYPTITEWNFLVVISLYALGRLHCHQEDAIREAPSEDRRDPICPPRSLLGAYVLASAPYTVDSMLLAIDRQEYQDDGTVVALSSPDSDKKGAGTTTTVPFISETMSFMMPRSGIQLLVTLCELFAGFVGGSRWWDYRCFREKLQPIYLDALARNVRTIAISYESGGPSAVPCDVLGGKGEHAWEDILTDDFESTDQHEAFRTEFRKMTQNENTLNRLRMALRRRELGWWDDALYEDVWNERHEEEEEDD